MFKKLLLCLIFLFPTSASAKNWTPMIATEVAAVTMQEKEIKEKVPRSECKECNGTGKVKAGDGVTIVWRECDNCYDDSGKDGGVSPTQYSAIVISADWCRACQQLKNGPIRNLENKGYDITVKKYSDVGRKYNVQSLPTTIFFENGKEIKRLTGYRGESTIEHYLKPKTQKTIKSRLTPNQLRAWCRTYRGQPYYVRGMGYKAHLMDSRATAHEGGPFEAWQLRGLTTGELMKIHGGQHTGKLTPFGVPP